MTRQEVEDILLDLRSFVGNLPLFEDPYINMINIQNEIDTTLKEITE